MTFSDETSFESGEAFLSKETRLDILDLILLDVGFSEESLSSLMTMLLFGSEETSQDLLLVLLFLWEMSLPSFVVVWDTSSRKKSCWRLSLRWLFNWLLWLTREDARETLDVLRWPFEVREESRRMAIKSETEGEAWSTMTQRALDAYFRVAEKIDMTMIAIFDQQEVKEEVNSKTQRKRRDWV